MARFWRGRRPDGPGTVGGSVAPHEMRGVVLMDNTTIFGARHAFEWEGRSPGAMPSGVDLRSLMDVLEAIVLCHRIAVDDSSRSELAWPHLMSVSSTTDPFFRDTDLLASYSSLDAALLSVSARRVHDLLRSGQLVRQLGFLPTSDDLEILPPFYRDPEQFRRLTLDSLEEIWDDNEAAHDRAVVDADAALRTLVELLERCTETTRTLAYFAFRGFYYHELAHLLSASYMPHTWRSELIRNHLAEPSVRFGDFVRDETGQVRALLHSRINREFDAAPVLSAEFPVIASFVVGQATSRATLLSTAVDIRRSSKAEAFRNWVLDIEDKILAEADLPGIRRAQDDLRDVVRDLERELGLADRPRQQMKIKVGVPLASAEIPTRVPSADTGWLRRVLRRRTHLVFLRQVGRESAILPPFSKAFAQLAP